MTVEDQEQSLFGTPYFFEISFLSESIKMATNAKAASAAS